MSIVIGTVTTTPSSSLTLDLDALTTRVAKLLRRSDIDTEIQQWINFAQRELVDEINFPELRVTTSPLTLTVGDYDYGINTTPNGFNVQNYSREDRFYWKHSTSNYGRNLVPLARQIYDQAVEEMLNIGTPTPGDPLYYLIQYNTIYIYPAPIDAGTLTLTYYRLPNDMTQGSHVPDIENRWRHYLIPLAYYWGQIFLEKEDVNKILMWEKKIKSVTSKVKTMVTRRENRSLAPMRPRTGLEFSDRVY